MCTLKKILKTSTMITALSVAVFTSAKAADDLNCVLSPGCSYIGYRDPVENCSATSPICPLDSKWAHCLKELPPPTPSNPCDGLTSVSIPDNASCAEYDSSCSSVCTRWECNSRYATSKNGTMCYKTIPCNKGSFLYSDRRCYEYGTTDRDLIAIVINTSTYMAMGVNPSPNKTFDEAKAYCSSVGSGDWQSPSRTDLMAANDYRVESAISHLSDATGRPSLRNIICWTYSEAPEYGSDKAWYYGLTIFDNYTSKHIKYNACPVIQGYHVG